MPPAKQSEIIDVPNVKGLNPNRAVSDLSVSQRKRTINECKLNNYITSLIFIYRRDTKKPRTVFAIRGLEISKFS